MGRRFCLIPILLALSACYDDTFHAMQVIDGETDRQLYAKQLLTAAQSLTTSQAGPTSQVVEEVETAYLESQAAYAEILKCESDGPCKWNSLRYLCADVDQLLAARKALAPYSELLNLAETMSADRGPLTLDRVQALRRDAQADGQISALEADVLLLAGAAAAAHSLYAATPAGERELERRRKTHAIDEFKLRCG